MKKEKESNIFMGELKKILFSFTTKWRVGLGRVNRVTSLNGSFLNGSNGSRVKSGCELGRVDPYFSNNFFWK